MSKRHLARDDDLIRDPKALRTTLRRMQLANEAITFWNQDRTLKLMLRNDPDMDEEDDPVKLVSADLCIVVDEDDAAATRAMEMEHDGVFEESTMFVVDNFEVPMDGPDALDELLVATRRINALHRTTICGCGKYLIKDEAPVCLFCEMTAADQDLDTQFCAICQDTGARAHMATQACCSQTLHRTCLDAWRAKGEGETRRCPLCRAD